MKAVTGRNKTNLVFLVSNVGVVELPVGPLPATFGTGQSYFLQHLSSGSGNCQNPSLSIRNRRQNKKDHSSSSGNG
ncbi:MAG TPA: hypothetical protein VHF01_11100 [Candidatus Acidoferrum sp.]|nr:hypothetical protein [Candidatus Acidoferrum sp.]